MKKIKIENVLGQLRQGKLKEGDIFYIDGENVTINVVNRNKILSLEFSNGLDFFSGVNKYGDCTILDPRQIDFNAKKKSQVKAVIKSKITVSSYTRKLRKQNRLVVFSKFESGYVIHKETSVKKTNITNLRPFISRPTGLSNRYVADPIHNFYNQGKEYLRVTRNIIEDYERDTDNITIERLNQNYGYDKDNIIATWLGFSCECFLKSMLLQEGYTLDELKVLGHELDVLYASLDKDDMTDIIYDMINAGYRPLNNNVDIPEQFLEDITKSGNSFVDSRYSSTCEVHPDTEFMYRFSNVLERYCSDKLYYYDESRKEKAA